jgi:hypothetical protein
MLVWNWGGFGSEALKHSDSNEERTCDGLGGAFKVWSPQSKTLQYPTFDTALVFVVSLDMALPSSVLSLCIEREKVL